MTCGIFSASTDLSASRRIDRCFGEYEAIAILPHRAFSEELQEKAECPAPHHVSSLM
jgi:hypothetical protein